VRGAEKREWQAANNSQQPPQPQNNQRTVSWPMKYVWLQRCTSMRSVRSSSLLRVPRKAVTSSCGGEALAPLVLLLVFCCCCFAAAAFACAAARACRAGARSRW
jgi:hypothetical protein